MGAVAGENYLKLGIKHPQTLFFSGLFGLFYVGNIWGSAVSVQLIKIEKGFNSRKEIDRIEANKKLIPAWDIIWSVKNILNY